MFDLAWKMMMLTAECQQVVTLRMTKAVFGGAAADAEAQLMWSEKVDAAFRHGAPLMAGGSIAQAVDAYREIVQANVLRLSAA